MEYFGYVRHNSTVPYAFTEVTNHTGLWNDSLAWYSQSTTTRFVSTVWRKPRNLWFETNLTLSDRWASCNSSSIFYCTVIDCEFTFHTTILFGCFGVPVWTRKAKVLDVEYFCTFIWASFKSHTLWNNAQYVSVITTQPCRLVLWNIPTLSLLKGMTIFNECPDMTCKPSDDEAPSLK